MPGVKKQIVVVGLGLIGGSLAMALRGFEDYHVVGVARRREAVDFARDHGIGDEVTMDAEAAIRKADVVWLCMPPQPILDFMARYRDAFKPGALVTDVCGVKTAIVEGAKCLPSSVDFIGCHPMAGKEVSGIIHAEATLFRGAHFIMTPKDGNDPEHIALMERMAAYMDFLDVVHTTPEEHDATIAYTSQMMHVIAASVCDAPQFFDCKGFEGGSFQGCTRVASLDVPLWVQLFTMNRPAICRVVEELEQNLRAYREAILAEDSTTLREKLTYSSERKKRMNLEGPPRGDEYRAETEGK